jgi:N-acetylmuramoyl-L-alanine amidase
LPGVAEQSNQLHPDLFLSLHLNDEPGTEKAKGDFDIYISSRSSQAAQSGSYSTAIFSALQQTNILPVAGVCNHALGATCENCRNTAAGANRKIESTTNENIYLLKNAKVPCLVMILGNVKNSERMKQYAENNKLDAVCNAILSGIANGANQQNTAGLNSASHPENTNNIFSSLPGSNTPAPSCGGNKVAAVRDKFQ